MWFVTKRALTDPFVVAPRRAVGTRARLFASPTNERVFTEVGDHPSSLLRFDSATRCRLGAGSKHLGRAERKRSLTPLRSSRWAGTITREYAAMICVGLCLAGCIRASRGFAGMSHQVDRATLWRVPARVYREGSGVSAFTAWWRTR